jgi:membrane-associated phospholipid phosphatase
MQRRRQHSTRFHHGARVRRPPPRGVLASLLLAVASLLPVHAGAPTEQPFPGPLLRYLDAPTLAALAADEAAPPPAARAAAAPTVEIPLSPRFWRRGVDDVVQLATAPARWEAPQWQRFGLGLAAVGLTIAVLDEPIRDAIDPRPDRNSLIDRVDRLGERRTSHLLMAGFYGYGLLQDDVRAKAVAVDALYATVIANGLVTSKLKRAFGRDRPYLGGDAHAFDAFGGREQDQRAFPSGHTTEAFAVAGVIATHYADSPAVVWTAYGLAALNGVSRMKKDQHWASDVLAGAMIGGGIGRMVARHNQREREAELALAYGEDGPLLVYQRRWR